jgi:long-chain acyl-CoA synthetase
MLEGIVVYPLLFVFGCVDGVVDLFKRSARKKLHKDMPGKEAVHCAQTDPKNPNSSFRCVLAKELMRLENDKSNLYDAFKESSKRLADVLTLGVRETIGHEDEAQENGKIFKKNIMKDEYAWMSYREVIDKVDHMSNGLLKLGIKSNDNIVIFSETRPEWLMSAFACFKIKVPIVTLYATLGISTFNLFITLFIHVLKM